MEQPLFAKSVEQASLPTTQWPSKNVDVAYYGPMVELLTQPTSSVPAPLADPSRVAAQLPEQAQPSARDVAPAPQSPSTTTAQAQEQPRAAPREVVRELSPQQSKQSRRARDQRQRDDARAGAETAATEQVDPREARTQSVPRSASAPRPRPTPNGAMAVDPSAATAIGMRPTRSMRDPQTAGRVTANGAWSFGKKSGSRISASCAGRNSAKLGFQPVPAVRHLRSALRTHDPFLDTSG